MLKMGNSMFAKAMARHLVSNHPGRMVIRIQLHTSINPYVALVD